MGSPWGHRQPRSMSTAADGRTLLHWCHRIHLTGTFRVRFLALYCNWTFHISIFLFHFSSPSLRMPDLQDSKTTGFCHHLSTGVSTGFTGTPRVLKRRFLRPCFTLLRFIITSDWLSAEWYLSGTKGENGNFEVAMNPVLLRNQRWPPVRGLPTLVHHPETRLSSILPNNSWRLRWLCLPASMKAPSSFLSSETVFIHKCPPHCTDVLGYPVHFVSHIISEERPGLANTFLKSLRNVSPTLWWGKCFLHQKHLAS